MDAISGFKKYIGGRRMSDMTEDFWKLAEKVNLLREEIEDAFSMNPKYEHAEYLNRMAKILGVID